MNFFHFLILPFLCLFSGVLASGASMADGVDAFFAGRMDESLRAFDAVITEEPQAYPYLWQRGLALYYAERFDDGVAQFEAHRRVNPNDVENPVWHFLCAIRSKGLEAARKEMLPVGPDPRVPMKEILALFKGEGGEDAVLKAARQGGEARIRDQLCYAHLYLGLYAEAMSQPEAARNHLVLAATEYQMPHYMGKVAQVHCRLRGWLPEPKPGNP